MPALSVDPVDFLRQNALPNRTARTDTSEYFERRDGIIVQLVHSARKQELVDAKANIAAFEELAQGQSHPVLVDMRASFATGPGVREYYASKEANAHTTALALLIGSATSRMIGNFFMKLNAPPMPTRLFTDPADAVRWLLTHKPLPISTTACASAQGASPRFCARVGPMTHAITAPSGAFR